MSERIITLFGEEVIPEQIKAVGKSRAKKKTAEKGEEGTEDNAADTDAKSDSAPAEQPATDMPISQTLPTDEEGSEDVTQPAMPAAETGAGEKTEIEEPATKGTKVKKEEKPTNLPEDWNGEKQYYSIGEVADLFKVKTSHIRFWTNEFKLKVRTTRKGDRLFTPAQIKELRAIHHLVKERGFTLTGAKAKLKTQNNMDVETVDLKQSLLQLRNKLMAIKNQLK